MPTHVFPPRRTPPAPVRVCRPAVLRGQIRSTRALGAALLCLVAQPALAQSDRCSELPPPSVTIKHFDEPVTFNTRFSYKELTHLGAAAVRPGQQVLGLTRGKAVVQFASEMPTYRDPTQRWECFSPQITLTIGFSPMTVYVAKEFPEGSCAYQEIYAHEQRHVKTYQAHLASMEISLGETLRRRFATGRPWRGEQGEARAQLLREIQERWTPYVQREFTRGDAAQALLDTPEEYERVASSCDGEIRKRLR